MLYLEKTPQNSIPLTTPKLLSEIAKVSLEQDGSLVLLRELEKWEENNGRYNMCKLQKDEKYDINISFTQKEIFFVEYSQVDSITFLPLLIVTDLSWIKYSIWGHHTVNVLLNFRLSWNP